MVPSYTGSSSYLIVTKYNNYVAAETGYYGGNGVNEIAILDPYATQTTTRNDINPSLQVMKEVMTVTSPTGDSGYIGSYPNAVREWCTNGTAVDPATDSVFINNEDGYSIAGTSPPIRSPRPSKSAPASVHLTLRRPSAPTASCTPSTAERCLPWAATRTTL